MKKVFIDQNGKIVLMPKDRPGVSIILGGFEEAYFSEEDMEGKKVGDKLNKTTLSRKLTREEVNRYAKDKQ